MSVSGRKLIYIGNDEVYLKALKTEVLKHYSSLNIEVLHFFEKTPQNIQSLFIKIHQLKPFGVLIDFSKFSDEYRHLARILARSNSPFKYITVGLFDYLTNDEEIIESYMSGVSINHVKGAEVFDVLFSLITRVSFDERKDHGFATAQVNANADVNHLCKIGFVNPSAVHFETNLTLKNDQSVELSNQMVEQKLLLSKKINIKEVSQQNTFYRFSYAVDAEFLYVDEPKIGENEAEEKIIEKKAEYDYNLKRTKKKFKTWVEENVPMSEQKLIKALIIDKDFLFYKNQNRSDDYEASIRCHPFLIDPADEIKKMKPDLICYSLDLPEEGEEEIVVDEKEEIPQNILPELKKLVRIIRRMPDYEPFVIVGNSLNDDSESLKARFNYPNLMASSGAIEPQVIVKMSMLLKKKKQKHQTEASKDKDPVPFFYMKKSNKMTNAFIKGSINIITLSESDILFTTDTKLSTGTSIKIDFPFKGVLTICEHPQYSKDNEYYAVINGIGETQKKSLRKFVNDIFFRDLEEQKKQEKEEFESLNKQFLMQQETDKAEAQAKAIEEERIKKEEAIAEAAEQKKREDEAKEKKE